MANFEEKDIILYEKEKAYRTVGIVSKIFDNDQYGPLAHIVVLSDRAMGDDGWIEEFEPGSTCEIECADFQYCSVIVEV